VFFEDAPGSIMTSPLVHSGLRRSLSVIVLIGLVSCAQVCGSPNSLSPKDRQEIFERVWKEISQHYYDPKFGGVDWSAIHQKYAPLIPTSKNDAHFYSTMDHLTSELHDAHTRFSSPEQWENRKKHQGVSIGFRAGYAGDKVVVLDVYPESNATRAGIETGMVVTTLEGEPVAERLKKSAQNVLESSTERVTRLRILGNAFSGPLEKPFAASFERADGSILRAKYDRQLLSNAPRVTSARLPSGFGYIRFDEYQHSVLKDFKRALERLRSVPGLILDLRWNRGGDGATLQTIANCFFDKKTLFERRMSRKQVAASEKDGEHTQETRAYTGGRGEQIYTGPVVILVSVYSASATEVFSAGMQDAGRATIVGTQTCGCVLGITHDRVMKGGGVLEISEILWFSPKGRKLEGEGVIPDVQAAPTIESLQQKRDLVLEAGEKVLQEKAAAKSGAAAR
jgi:carboxyl-terminal processing protease